MQTTGGAATPWRPHQAIDDFGGRRGRDLLRPITSQMSWGSGRLVALKCATVTFSLSCAHHVFAFVAPAAGGRKIRAPGYSAGLSHVTAAEINLVTMPCTGTSGQMKATSGFHALLTDMAANGPVAVEGWPGLRRPIWTRCCGTTTEHLQNKPAPCMT